jgi:hypothetical protein
LSVILHEVADFILTRSTGNPRRKQTDFRAAVMNAIGRRENLVLEDREMDVVLLLCLSVDVSDAANPLSYEPHYLFTRYGVQTRRTMSTNDVLTELKLVKPTDISSADMPGRTLVMHWQDEIFIAFQRLAQTNRWTRRTFPYKVPYVIGVHDFLTGWRAHGGWVPDDLGGPHNDDFFPLLDVD